MNREFLMLAKEYNPLKNKADGSFVSIKLDGMRALWLPRTRDLRFQDIEFANKTKDDRDHICSGLWSRLMKPIMAPPYFLDALPKDMPLDGELYIDKNSRQKLMSTVKKLDPDYNDWMSVKYHVFDIPNYNSIFLEGRIRVDTDNEVLIRDTANLVHKYGDQKWAIPRRFEANYNYMKAVLGDGIIKVHNQELLPFNRIAAETFIESQLNTVTSEGGEGLMLRRPHSEWFPKRSDELLKVKKLNDAEGTVIGYTYGSGKLHGLIGSVRIKTIINNKTIERDLSGFTDNERTVNSEFRGEAISNPGVYTSRPASTLFPLNSIVTFRYRGLTKDGIPEEARYWRKRED